MRGITGMQLDLTLAWCGSTAPMSSSGPRLTRLSSGRVLVTNVDPMSLSDGGRFELNERIKRNPRGFVYLDIRPEAPGGELAMRGAIERRSRIQVRGLLARGLRRAPAFDVTPDPRMGPVADNPRSTPDIRAPEAGTQLPAKAVSAECEGQMYGIAKSPRDDAVFATSDALCQTSVGEIRDLGIPIMTAK